MQRVLLVVGSAGAGKSTLVNALSGKNEAHVGHNMFVDGTESVLMIRDSADLSLSYIDTPGLDSDNVVVSVTEQVQQTQRKHGNKPLLICLVIDKKAARATSYLSTFEKLRDNLVGDIPFVVVWTREGDVSADNQVSAAAKFPKAIFCDSNNLIKLKELLRDSSKFKTPNSNTTTTTTLAPPRVRNAVVLSTESAASVPLTKKQRKKLQKKNKKIRLLEQYGSDALLGFPATTNTLFSFKQSAMKSKKRLKVCVDEVIKIKEHGSDGRYQRMKLFGDAYLKPFVLSALQASGETDELETQMLKIISNKQGSPLQQFFQAYIADAHNMSIPNERDKMTDHAKADFVEALLEYSRVNAPSIYHFILTELLADAV